MTSLLFSNGVRFFISRQINNSALLTDTCLKIKRVRSRGLTSRIAKARPVFISFRMHNKLLIK